MSEINDNNNNICDHFDTKAIHAGEKLDHQSIVTTITHFKHDPTTIEGYSYSRFGNPNRDILQRTLAELDNGKHGLVYPSGSAATHAVLSLLKPGDHMVSSFDQFGGTREIFIDYTEQQGIEMTFVDTTNLEWLSKVIQPNTKLIWIETPSNPLSKITDIDGVVEIARSHTESEIIVVADNTLLTPYVLRPIEMGVDIVIYSLTKYINGHNDVLGGALIVNDDELHKRLQYFQMFYGSTLSPFDCFLVNRGIKTLPLRMDRHFANTLTVAKYLESHPKVVKVYHPGLPSNPQYELAKKQCSGNCGLVAIELSGTEEQTIEFLKNLRVFQSCGSLGSYTSFVSIPVYGSHYGIPKEVLNELGLPNTLIRLLPGLESIKDLIADLEQAFEKTYNQANK